eukprot:Tbor_TRINITY_DN5279_c0_g1::TRINITY_DN5279_c0_g1_i1::g.16535::m.16535
MQHWEVELSEDSWRFQDEVRILTKSGVGLYELNTQVPSFQSCKAILTSFRLILISFTDKGDSNLTIYLNLSDVDNVSLTGGLSSWFYPKISVVMKPSGRNGTLHYYKLSFSDSGCPEMLKDLESALRKKRWLLAKVPSPSPQGVTSISNVPDTKASNAQSKIPVNINVSQARDKEYHSDPSQTYMPSGDGRTVVYDDYSQRFPTEPSNLYQDGSRGMDNITQFPQRTDAPAINLSTNVGISRIMADQQNRSEEIKQKLRSGVDVGSSGNSSHSSKTSENEELDQIIANATQLVAAIKEARRMAGSSNDSADQSKLLTIEEALGLGSLAASNPNGSRMSILSSSNSRERRIFIEELALEILLWATHPMNTEVSKRAVISLTELYAVYIYARGKDLSSGSVAAQNTQLSSIYQAILGKGNSGEKRSSLVSPKDFFEACLVLSLCNPPSSEAPQTVTYTQIIKAQSDLCATHGISDYTSMYTENSRGGLSMNSNMFDGMSLHPLVCMVASEAYLTAWRREENCGFTEDANGCMADAPLSNNNGFLPFRERGNTCLTSNTPQRYVSIRKYSDGSFALQCRSISVFIEVLEKMLGPFPSAKDIEEMMFNVIHNRSRGARRMSSISATQFGALLGVDYYVAFDILCEIEDTGLLCRSQGHRGRGGWLANDSSFFYEDYNTIDESNMNKCDDDISDDTGSDTNDGAGGTEATVMNAAEALIAKLYTRIPSGNISDVEFHWNVFAFL